jgi:hypothetical protein
MVICYYPARHAQARARGWGRRRESPRCGGIREVLDGFTYVTRGRGWTSARRSGVVNTPRPQNHGSGTGPRTTIM